MIKIDDMPRRIAVGRTLDNGYSALQIDCGEWMKRHPQLTEYRIEVKRPDGEMYFADTTFADGVLTWNINAADTAIAGDGEFQVVAIGTDGERKTSSHPIMFVSDIIAGMAADTPPEPNKAWTDRVIEETRKSATQAAASAAEAKETLESIPEDYTELSEEVGKLSEEIGNKLDRYGMSINRLSTDGEQVGYALNKDTGGVYSADGYRVSDYCDVRTDNPHGTITIRGLTLAPRCCFYDGEKIFISTIEGVQIQTSPVSLPDGTAYVRVQSSSEFTNAFVNIGSDVEYHDPNKRPEVVIPQKMSDLINDEQFFSAKKAGEILPKHVDFTLYSKNLLDESKIVDGGYVNYENGAIVAGASFEYTDDYVDISDNDGAICIFEFTALNQPPAAGFFRCAFYNKNKTYISGVDNNPSAGFNDINRGVVAVPSGAAYVRCSWVIRATHKHRMIAYGDSTDMTYEAYGLKDANPAALYDKIQNVSDGVNGWRGLTWVSYGDSITAQGNNGHPTSYQYYVDSAIGFAQSYRRGVGGQTYKVNTNTFYANPDGSYAGRYGMDGLTEPPEGTTTHLGYFASWDRITAMIPDSIRESIDLVMLCGGTNDHVSVEDVETDGVISAGTPVWVPNSAVDAHWAASEHYAGGDYDISTFAGAIASTITKMRIWCPNAIVVLATPYPRWDTDTMQQYTNSSGLDFRGMCEIQIAAAKYMGCPVVDANAMCCVGGANFASTVSDGVHPNAMGVKLYGKALADGLNTISPKIV